MSVKEIITIDNKDLKNIIKYALTKCESECPSGREAEKCWSLIHMCRVMGMEDPPCVKEWGGLSIEILEEFLKKIEKRRGKPILTVISELRENIVTVEDMIDYQEATFALALLEVLKRRGEP